MADQMDCAHLESLQTKYKQAADEFTEAIKAISSGNRIPTKKLRLLTENAEAAEAKAETARRALRNHIIEHGCC